MISYARRIPWFKFYASDWITSDHVAVMSLAAKGAYISLLARCWLNLADGCSIPDDDVYLQAVTNSTPEEWQTVKSQVLANFQLRDGRWFNLKLCEISEEAVQKSELAQQAIAVRWENARAKKQLRIGKEGKNKSKNENKNVERPNNGRTTDVSPSHLLPFQAPTESSDSLADAADLKARAKKADDIEDVARIKQVCHEVECKLPNTKDVQAVLDKFPVEEVEGALREYTDNHPDSADLAFAEKLLFADGGIASVIQVRRKRVEDGEK